DGLSSMVDNRTILEVAERYRNDLDEAVRALLAAANLAGGEDNITVVLFEITEESDEPDERTLEAVDAGAREQPPGADEEDTLSELDRVDAVGATDSAQPAQPAQPAPGAPR